MGLNFEFFCCKFFSDTVVALKFIVQKICYFTILIPSLVLGAHRKLKEFEYPKMKFRFLKY